MKLCLEEHASHPPYPNNPQKEDGLFVYLRLRIPTPKTQETRNNTCILADIRRLFNTRVSTFQDIARNQILFQRPSRQIEASLKADWRRRQVETYGGNIKDLLTSEPTLHKNE